MNSALELNRRSFVKRMGASAMATAGLGALEVTSAFAAENAANDQAASVDQIQWDEEFDIVIMGAGIAGQSAAITVATEGEGATVLLAEKADGPFGNSPYARGVALWTNSEYEQAMIGYLKQLMSPYGTTPDDMIEAFAKGCTENRDWLLSLGAADSYLFETQPGEPNTDGLGGEYPELPGGEAIGWVGVGPATGADETVATCAWMINEIETTFADSIDYRTEHAVVGLVQDPSSREILGVILEHGGSELYVRARKGVIMACGGFENNVEMMQDYVGMGAAHPCAGFGNTGDGVHLAIQVGADLRHMNSCAGFWMMGRDLDNTYSTDTALVKDPTPKQFGITVGLNGRRYYQDWDAYVCNPGYTQESEGTFAQHVGYRHGHTQFGGEWPHLPFPEKSWFVFDQAGLKAGALKSEDPVGENLAYKAETLEELAEMIDVPADELVRTVEVWNRYCEQGFDEAFYRPAEYMTPIAEAPFYAQLVVPHFLNTDGGARRSARGEVLGTDGEPIPGLFSAGEFGSIWGNYYQGTGNFAEGMIFGRISARSALAR